MMMPVLRIWMPAIYITIMDRLENLCLHFLGFPRIHHPPFPPLHGVWSSTHTHTHTRWLTTLTPSHTHHTHNHAHINPSVSFHIQLTPKDPSFTLPHLPPPTPTHYWLGFLQSIQWSHKSLGGSLHTVVGDEWCQMEISPTTPCGDQFYMIEIFSFSKSQTCNPIQW